MTTTERDHTGSPHAGRRDARASAIVALLVLAAFFVAINLFADAALRRARLDLTADRLFTLTDGTRAVLSRLDPAEPLRLRLFYSQSLATGRPAVQAYAQRVREVLDEYELASGGGLVVEEVDPEPFSVGEERAQRAGIPPIEVAPGESFYFGIEGADATDRRQTIPFLDPRDEPFLEYELSSLVHTLQNPRRPVIGLMTDLPMRGGMPAMPGQPPSPAWEIIRQLEANYELRDIGADDAELDDDLDLLLIVHAKQIGPAMLRLIDRYALSAKPLVIFQDPFCGADLPPGAQQNPMLAAQALRASNLNELTVAWGVEMAEGQVAGDRALAIPVGTPQGATPFLPFLALRDEQIDRDDPTTREVSLVQIGSAGALSHDPASTAIWTPLLRTTNDSMLLGEEQVGMFAQPRDLLARFVARGEPITLAGRLSGRVRSAFAGSPPSPAEEGEPPMVQGPDEGSINLVLFADADLLEDRWWIEAIRLGGGGPVLGYSKFADNGALVLNVIDHMAGSPDLISVRARGTFARPFTRVQELQRQAEQRYAERAEALETNRREAERKLAELQRARPDQGEFILTPEQEREIARFRDELLQTTRELREVQYGLNKDVEALGVRVKAINIAGAPVLVAAAAIGLGAYRASRRRADRRAALNRE